MANQLKMAIIQSILELHSADWSRRRIAGKQAGDLAPVRCLAVTGGYKLWERRTI